MPIEPSRTSLEGCAFVAPAGVWQASAMIQTEPIVYDGPGGTFEGTVSWDDSIAGTRPGVMIAHAFGGQGDFDIAKAEKLAAMGYVGLTLDMYGQGVRASTPEESSELMQVLLDDRALLAARINRAHEVLVEHPLVDPARTGAIGFCFGGLCLLDLARSGADVLGVASFHGIFTPPEQATTEPIGASVLVLHGWDDPLAQPDDVVALAAELTERQADWQILAFGHTGHAFTNPTAQAPEVGMQYNEKANDRSWRAMTDFLADLFAG